MKLFRLYKSLVLAGILTIFSALTAHAQMCELGFSLGVSTYQGDISPLGWRVSFEGAHVAKGAFLSYSVNDYFSLKARYYSAFLSATDENALSEGRRDRNLHFKSSLKEISLVGELKLLSLIPALRKFKVQPYINAGIGVFRFNPQGKYKGIWHDLQPLGTEGQGLPGSGKEKYSRTQFSIPFGIGIKYQVNEEFVIGFEASPRWTFTDYLDDVSTSFPDLSLLAQERGDVAVALSTGGRHMYIDDADLSFTNRGNAGENDWYFITTVSVAYRFDPGMYFDRRKGFQGNWKCPYD